MPARLLVQFKKTPEKRVRVGICTGAVFGTNSEQFGIRLGVPATNLDVHRKHGDG